MLFIAGTILGQRCFYFMMVAAEDIRKAVLVLARKRESSTGVTPAEVAQYLQPAQWHTIVDQVKLVMDALVQEGKLKSNRRNGDDTRFVYP